MRLPVHDTVLLLSLALVGEQAMCGRASAQTSKTITTADAAELADAAQLLDLPDVAEDQVATDKQEGASYLVDVGLSTSVVTRGHMPDTRLLLQFPDDQGAGAGMSERCQALAPDGRIRWLVERLLCPQPTNTYAAAMASLYFEWEPWDWLWLRTLADTGEIRDGATLDPPLRGITLDGQTPDKEFGAVALFMRELSVTVGRPGLSLEVGRFRANVANGLVLDDFVGGLRGLVDFETINGNPLRAEVLIAGFQREAEEPTGGLIAARLDWDISTFEWASVFMALAGDRDGGLSDVLRSAYAEGAANEASSAPFSGTSDDVVVQQVLFDTLLSEDGGGGAAYIGGQLSLLPIAGLSLRGTLALMSGRLLLDVPSHDLDTGAVALEALEVQLRAWAGNLETHYGLSRHWDLGSHLFVLSGDTPPGIDGDRYRSFVAPAPFWVWTGLFFSGGLSQGFYPSRASSAGINGRGAVGVGPSIEYARANLRALWRCIYLHALAPPPRTPGAGDGRSYGLEIDMELEWQPWPLLRLGAEVDLLFPGDFFYYRDVAYRMLVIASLEFGT